jgi:hypothetical protein
VGVNLDADGIDAFVHFREVVLEEITVDVDPEVRIGSVADKFGR